MNTRHSKQASTGLSRGGTQPSNCKKLLTLTTERTSIYASLCNQVKRRMNIPADLPMWMFWFYGAWCALILFFKWWFK